MKEKNRVIANSEVVEYLEALYFRYQSLEMVVKMQYIPSQYIEIDNDTKEFYLEKFNEARAMYMLTLQEIKEHYFPDATSNENITVNFETNEVTLEAHKCNCGGSCSR